MAARRRRRRRASTMERRCSRPREQKEKVYQADGRAVEVTKPPIRLKHCHWNYFLVDAGFARNGNSGRVRGKLSSRSKDDDARKIMTTVIAANGDGTIHVSCRMRPGRERNAARAHCMRRWPTFIRRRVAQSTKEGNSQVGRHKRGEGTHQAPTMSTPLSGSHPPFSRISESAGKKKEMRSNLYTGLFFCRVLHQNVGRFFFFHFL